MRFCHLLFVFVYLVSIVICVASVQDERAVYHSCSEDNYTSNSIYQKNLNSLFSSLSSNDDITYGFYNISEGQGTDEVNAIALCRGDINQTACRTCVNFATSDLPKRCPNRREGTVWYDNCTLRYSNKSIFSAWEQPDVYIAYSKDVSVVKLFIQQLAALLSKLSEKASAGDSRVKFAVGDTSYVDSTRIYGLVQCTPNLNQVQCSNCLDRSFGDITGAFSGEQGGRVIGPSCNIRYDIDQFYQIPSRKY